MNKLTPQSKNFADWYNEIVQLSDLAEYSDVKGCMIIKPYGYALWENIQEEMNKRIKAIGVDNVYMPLFIPESYFKKEAEHVKGFAPEVAWVTHAGGKKLEERLAIRPTSETIMYRTFAKWVHSYRDLPLKVNQWANIVRWEMRTRLFLRTTEFLWQEGHTLHTTEKQADEMVDQALELYKNFVNEFLGIYVLNGIKSQAEKFAGAEYTKAIEGMMKDKKALQMGTSHSLGQNFAKVFGIEFLDQEGKKQTPWPTSWGVSTRMIGGIIMAHGDDKGLVLPPKIAPIQVIIIPIYKNSDEEKKIKNYIKNLEKNFKNIKYKIDWDHTNTPGWKFNQWEMKGVPVRMEVGPKDVQKNQVILARRDTGEKLQVKLVNLAGNINNLLNNIQDNLLKNSENNLKSNIKNYTDYNKYKKDIKKENFFALVNWCESKKCEDQIKYDTKATARVYAENKSGKCIVCAKETNKQVYLAKAY